MRKGLTTALRKVPESKRRTNWIKALKNIGYDDNEIHEAIEIEESFNIPPSQERKIKREEQRQLRRWRQEYRQEKGMNNSKNGVTNDEIEQAQEYPISELLEVNRAGFALCPYHNDTRPSLYTKNGFGYCFVCGKSASPISLYMKISGAGFVEAVKFLAGG